MGGGAVAGRAVYSFGYLDLALLCMTLHHLVPYTTLYLPLLCMALHHLVLYLAPHCTLHCCALPCTTLSLHYYVLS